MKRFAVFLALFAFLVPLLASAGTKLFTDQVGFHTSLAAYSYGYGDSNYVYRGTGIEASDEQVDTTQVVDLRMWVMPGPQYGTTVASDTLTWLRVNLVPDGTSPAVAGDTVDVTIQVSDDNRTWTTVPWTGPKISPDVASMVAGAVLETGTSNSWQFPIAQVIGGATQSVFNRAGTGAPTANQIYGFRSARFIFRGDFTGRYLCYVTGFIPDQTVGR